LCVEVKAALFDKGLNKTLVNYIYGLGGREIRTQDIEGIYNELLGAVKGKSVEKIQYLGVRE
ncbi:MAG: pyruvate ferredoxin oxidoreductase, partial [Candidatus Omnitrophota bacterium]